MPTTPRPRRRLPPRPSDHVDTCLHRTFRELTPGVMVCLCGLNLDETRRRVQESQPTTGELNKG
ncbi:hypothetical protein [Gordonia aichiensis]|uniref:hypothetical protein n=1 Tax=Gordonia aichiensis TaxID=36820 RepID=UPI0032678791